MLPADAANPYQPFEDYLARFGMPPRWPFLIEPLDENLARLLAAVRLALLVGEPINDWAAIVQAVDADGRPAPASPERAMFLPCITLRVDAVERGETFKPWPTWWDDSLARF